MGNKNCRTWESLAAGPPVFLAVDTEYQGGETLTVQFAARVGDTVRVQVYYAADLPAPPRGCFRRPFAARFPARVVVRPPKPLAADLSPGRVLADLFGLPPARFLSRNAGDAGRPPDTPGIAVKLVGHFLPVDFLRAFGRRFLIELLAPPDRPPGVALREGRVVGFVGTGGVADRFADPVVEQINAGGGCYELRLGTMDTNCVCGPAKLDELARSYVGVAKDEAVGDADKERMAAVFRDPRRTADAYRYAVQDAVLTLLVAERMHEEHADLYAGFGIPPEAVPPMHGTPGLRATNLILQYARHTAAAGAGRLGAAGSGPAGLNKVKELAGRGAAAKLGDGRASRYGRQTADTHGGLLYSRSPTAFHHRADGQFRDLDLQSCYPAILSSMTVYLGRPVVFEPGHAGWTLKRAVAYLDRHADGESAWFVKVSGPIAGFANTLVPSTVDALTNDNYRKRAARAASTDMLARKAQALARERADDRQGTALLSDEVNAGVVTWATWLVIQALPLAARRQYENLRAESVVFYPGQLAAGSGTEFDALVTKYRKEAHEVDWKQELDLGGMTRTTVEDIDETYVSLRYPVGELADRLVELREGAGKDTATGRLYKTLANTLYGALACPVLPTSNPVAANVVTATARAVAYAMTLSLNALQVVTDGVLYRADRIPADALSTRLRRSVEYPLLHADTGPFIDPADIPADAAGFADWYAGHVLRFFGVAGRPAHERLFRLHTVAHKPLPDGRSAFDGVCVDGGANVFKLARDGGGQLRVADAKARGFRGEAKKRLAKWLLKTYRSDTFVGPPAEVPADRPLRLADALDRAGQAVGPGGAEAAVVPLGHWQPAVSTYKLIKWSAFVFRTARQRARLLADWRRLNRETECGPELLAVRRTFGGRLTAVAAAVYVLVRAGADRLSGLNVDRLWRAGAAGRRHGEAVRAVRVSARTAFTDGLAVAGAAAAPPTGLVVDGRGLNAVQTASAAVS